MHPIDYDRCYLSNSYVFCGSKQTKLIGQSGKASGKFRGKTQTIVHDPLNFSSNLANSQKKDRYQYKNIIEGRIFPVKKGTSAVLDTDTLFHQVAQVRPANLDRDKVMAGPEFPTHCRLKVQLLL